MKRIAFLAFACMALISACNNENKTSGSEDKKDSAELNATGNKSARKHAAPDSATMMKNWEAYMTPGKPHEMMASWNGTWSGEVKMWQEPGTEPQSSQTKAVNKMIMGGRYQASTHTGNMMGMPFEGESLLGYDNSKKEFISTWVDNMGTGIMVLTGPWDEASKTMTLKGRVVDAAAGNGEECDVREVYKVIDDNTHLMEMYGPDPKTGKEFKMMELRLTRKK